MQRNRCLLICLWFLNANKLHSFRGHSSYLIWYPLNHKLHLLYQYNIILNPGTLVGLICHGTQQLFPLTRAEIRILATPEDCAGSENGLGKTCPDDPGYALWPFLQKKKDSRLLKCCWTHQKGNSSLTLSLVHVYPGHVSKWWSNISERKLKRQYYHVRGRVSALFFLHNKYKSPLPQLFILTV